jgi:hypothetical protein
MYRGSDSIVASRVGNVSSLIGSDAAGNRTVDPGLEARAWAPGKAGAKDERNGTDGTYGTDETNGTFPGLDCVGNRTSGKIVIPEHGTPYLRLLRGPLEEASYQGCSGRGRITPGCNRLSRCDKSS